MFLTIPQKLGVLVLALLINTNLMKSQQITINGKLYDKDQNNVISWGNVFLSPGNQVSQVNPEGEFSFTCMSGQKQISTRVFGYKPFLLRFSALSDTIVNLYLQQDVFELNEVLVEGDSSKTINISVHGNISLNPVALRLTPRLFSEPDLLKSFQLLPGVISGKEGIADIYVRGGGAGQNIIHANGCSFFLPSHLLGFVSPYDMDFLSRAELFKDYIPPELDGGASSVISIDFKENRSDSMRTQFRLGLLSSSIVVEMPYRLNSINMSMGLRRSNYSIYAPLLKRMITDNAGNFLPPKKYSFYDGFINLSYFTPKSGRIDYLFFGNYDRQKEVTEIRYQLEDTLTNFMEKLSSGWNSMVHSISWRLPEKKNIQWQFLLNYNRLSTGRNLYKESKTQIGNTVHFESNRYTFSPLINKFSSTLLAIKTYGSSVFTAGISQNYTLFSPQIKTEYNKNDTVKTTIYEENSGIFKPALFASSKFTLIRKIQFDAGFRLSTGFTGDNIYFVPEPRLRITYNPGKKLSPHINYVRLSQYDHSVTGSNAGIRSLLWVPAFGNFGPEVSDIFSAGFQGRTNKGILWTLDAYYKKLTGMLDYKPGASFIFDTSFVDILDHINGKAYGIETGIFKNTGNITYNISYTYSRSKRQWSTPEGVVWVPSSSDRPHNFNFTLRWYNRERTSFGLNWVYQSGEPATIYMHTTSYGELLDTKNNIRYFDYHRLDFSFRWTIYKRKYSMLIDFDIYNLYNRHNTFYFKEAYDNVEKKYYYKNIFLFPIMPSLSITVKI